MKCIVRANTYWDDTDEYDVGVFDTREMAITAIEALGEETEPGVDPQVHGIDYTRKIRGVTVYFWLGEVAYNSIDLEGIARL